jgi:hypothetical protein
MRIEIVLFLIAAAIMANIYTDGKILKNAFAYKKYYQMAAVALGAFVVYYLFKRNPENMTGLIQSSHEYLKYMPVDKHTSSLLNPILDFTSKYSAGGSDSLQTSNPVLNMNQPSRQSYAESRLQQSGQQSGANVNGASDNRKTATKRSVSETKKKYVAAQQNWCCGNCKKQLPAWFEVDHKVRLEHGGSNHIDNLVALCRDCHGEKTAIENL